MAFNEELAIRQLIAMYRAGFQDIIGILIEKDARGLSTRHQRSLLENIYQILFAMDAEADLWIQEVVGKVYSSTASNIIITLADMGYPKPTESFSRVHQRSVDVIAQNMSGNLRGATQYVGRRVSDVFRQVGLEQTGKKIVEGASWQDLQKKITQELLDKGQTAFVDKLGRKWRLDSYAEMVARTTTREAASVATINQCKESGCDLVQISEHHPTCHLCAPLQGKVYSLSGSDKRYPAYGDNVKIPVHPNCRHVLTPYSRDLDSNAEETQKHSNTSLTEDTRTEQEKEAYKDTQDAVRIASNKRKAREVLYTPSAPMIDKVHAAHKLKKTYENMGVNPAGRDAGLLQQYEDWLKLGKVVDINEKTGIITVEARSLPRDAIPNATIDRLNRDDKVEQRRFFDDKGKARLDIDLTDHNRPKAHPVVPHSHDWCEKRRDKWRKLTVEERALIDDLKDGDR